uniref:Lymphocyte antigen 86 isoform X3 n=1 Tax=Geotrypetes seraphini TaxID=260995 RepID=A0A6P8QE60_GEOSA|nr:lymphocyte antigen 86 isoform X3 [Geotrypetes seraphini]
MDILTAAVSALSLFCLSESKEWPMHTICSGPNLEGYYRSCDPLQDIGLSIEPCFKTLPEVVQIKIALLLQLIYFEGPVKFGIGTIPTEGGEREREKDPTLEGEYNVSLELFNEDNYNIACGNLTLVSH